MICHTRHLASMLCNCLIIFIDGIVVRTHDDSFVLSWWWWWCNSGSWFAEALSSMSRTAPWRRTSMVWRGTWRDKVLDLWPRCGRWTPGKWKHMGTIAWGASSWTFTKQRPGHASSKTPKMNVKYRASNSRRHRDMVITLAPEHEADVFSGGIVGGGCFFSCDGERMGEEEWLPTMHRRARLSASCCCNVSSPWYLPSSYSVSSYTHYPQFSLSTSYALHACSCVFRSIFSRWDNDHRQQSTYEYEKQDQQLFIPISPIAIYVYIYSYRCRLVVGGTCRLLNGIIFPKKIFLPSISLMLDKTWIRDREYHDIFDAGEKIYTFVVDNDRFVFYIYIYIRFLRWTWLRYEVIVSRQQKKQRIPCLWWYCILTYVSEKHVELRESGIDSNASVDSRAFTR